ncbi:MAG TPA: chemotaxis response regulator protein-glutamate methylesterase [Chthonomonadales bacterium]|nr:chemotaxis response regulator protein-glutamate methylesterase [Chthonomonadales bacterium]
MTAKTESAAPVRVLVVDDSAFMRKMVGEILNRAGMEVVAVARDGMDALEKARRLRPDVITLDVEMPRMDGLTFLSELMPTLPTPVVVLSSLASHGAETTIRCLERGAFDCLHKPSGAISLDIDTIGAEIVAKVQAAARARRCGAWVARPLDTGRQITGRQAKATIHQSSGPVRHTAVVIIASSTGGPGALQQVLPLLPADLQAAVVVVQHLPVGFTAALSKRLDASSALSVREAYAGDTLERGKVLVAPGGVHLAFDAERRVTLDHEPPIWGVRPAADVAMRSAAERFGPLAIAVVLTGMGRDGALGAKAIQQHGGVCIAQDEATSVIFGMPRAALEAGAVDRLLPLDEIAGAIVEAVEERGG